jgi:plastocyanin
MVAVRTHVLIPVLTAVLAACSKAPPPPASAPAPPPLFQVDPATAGAVAGKVSYQGQRPARKRIQLEEEQACVELNPRGLDDESIVVNRDGTLANVFVWVKQGLEGKRFAMPEGPVVFDQKGCRFGPRVFGVRTGQIVRIVNSDPVTHNVHPQAQMNREWNQSQPPGGEVVERKFVRPEVMIKVKCNVHSWMRAYIGAVEHPYFAVTGADGSFSLPNLPPGEYTIEAWHEKLGTQEQHVTLAPGAKTAITFTFPGA